MCVRQSVCACVCVYKYNEIVIFRDCKIMTTAFSFFVFLFSLKLSDADLCGYVLKP